MRFQALELSIEVIRSLRRPVERIRTRDRKLYEQIRASASSVALNLSEGARRRGKDRLYHWSIAAGSADEARTSLLVAEAWGDIDREMTRESLELLDRLLAVLWKLTR